MHPNEHEQYPPIDAAELDRLEAAARKRRGDSWRDMARLAAALRDARHRARALRGDLREEYGGLCPKCRADIEDDEAHAPGCWYAESDLVMEAWAGGSEVEDG